MNVYILKLVTRRDGSDNIGVYTNVEQVKDAAIRFARKNHICLDQYFECEVAIADRDGTLRYDMTFPNECYPSERRIKL